MAVTTPIPYIGDSDAYSRTTRARARGLGTDSAAQAAHPGARRTRTEGVVVWRPAARLGYDSDHGDGPLKAQATRMRCKPPDQRRAGGAAAPEERRRRRSAERSSCQWYARPDLSESSALGQSRCGPSGWTRPGTRMGIRARDNSDGHRERVREPRPASWTGGGAADSDSEL